MKKLYAILTLAALLCCQHFTFAQGTNCASADPFCTGNSYTFPASTSTTAESGPEYGCLLDQPNPAWYYLQIATGGNLNINLTNSAGVDIDFICWGPFASLGTACSNLTGSGSFDGCSLFDSYPCGNIIDCSYSTAANETAVIPGAAAGQFYMFLITNYSGDPTDITASSTGTATTNCSIVPPQDCYFSFTGYEISPCNPNNTYNLSGEFTYEDNPGTGTVTVQVDNGTSTYTQTFNPPFVDGQTYAYNITNIPADGAASTVTFSFSADPACETVMNFTGVADCSCAADIGTQTAQVNGTTTTDYQLCFGDTFDALLNNDYTPPAEAFNPPGPIYDPGIAWLVYSCPPTVAVVPSYPAWITQDPCFEGLVTYGDLNEINDMYWIDNYPGVFTDNIVYFVPLTMYSMSTDTVSYTNTSENCYEMGAPFAVQYLPEITMTQVTNCATGEVTATINGGLPEIDGSQFTAVAGSLTPASASFVNTTCANGGNIVIDGLTSGQAYSFDVEDDNGCPITISGTMTGGGGATLTYPQTNYCTTDPNPSPTVTGSASGTFSSTAGLSINVATGVINLAASTPGPYTITYVGTGGACPPSATFNLTVNGVPTVSAGPDQNICLGQQVTLTGSGTAGNVYTWTNGVVNGVAFTPGATGTYTVTGTSAAGCINTDDVTVTVDPAAQPTFSANITSGCAPLTVTFTNLSGGSNCTWDFGDGTTGTGCATITHTYTTVGCYDVTLSTQSAAGCLGTATLTNYICVTPDPVASFVPNPGVLSTLNTTTQMINNSSNATTYVWNFGDQTSSTAFEPTHTYPAAEGNYLIELIVYTPSGCTDTAYAVIVVNEEIIYYVPNTFTPDGDENNQTFVPVFTSGYDPFDFNMKIFNRWGEIIFETNNDKIGWDGTYHEKLVQDGSYTWKIEFQTSESDARKVVVGHVNVVK